MTVQRLFNRKARRKVRAGLRHECLECGIAHGQAQCPLCYSHKVYFNMIDYIIALNGTIEKNSNRVARGARWSLGW